MASEEGAERLSFSNMFRDPTPPPSPVAENLGRDRAGAFNAKNIFSANNVKEMNKAALGYVLVWDMDQTITGDYFDVVKFPTRPLDINPKALEILRLAVKARNERRVAAILLLTNNSDINYVLKMIDTISRKLNVDKLFDDGMMAGTPGRNIPPGKPINYALKSFRDVKRMVTALNLSTENLPTRTFFFDDQTGHILTAELIKEGYEENFIKITPGYKEGLEDKTNWSSIEKALTEQGGGYRYRRNKRVRGYTKHIRRVSHKNRKTHSRKRSTRVCA
jgi:hypothetical protein